MAAAVRVTFVASSTSTTGAPQRLGQFGRAVCTLGIKTIVEATVAFNNIQRARQGMGGEGGSRRHHTPSGRCRDCGQGRPAAQDSQAASM